MKKFGDLVLEQRISLGLTLRQFCIKNNINSATLSKVERNIQIPNKAELDNLIDSLKIYEGSAEHAELLCAYNNFIPEKHNFSVQDLPIFFKPDVDPEKLYNFLKDSDNPDNSGLFN